MKNKVYITTPIYYVNDVPHIGHAYTTLAADIVARYWRRKLGDENVFLSTGTDEHGAKIADAAKNAGQEPKQFVDNLAPRFENVWKELDISYNAFIRTTDPVHEKYAQDFFQKLYDKQDIYLDEYEGLYCVGCEKFLTETELVEGKCPLHPNQEPVKQKEENYFLKLTKYIPAIKQAIESGELKILPIERQNEVLARINEGVKDLSISRKSVSWGIPVPWDKSQTIYVWVEALLNYLSVLKNKDIARVSLTSGDGGANSRSFPDAQISSVSATSFLSPTYQFMAKDIIWFHAVIWPALLLATRKPLPKNIFAHGYFTVNGQKMSKSLGNVVNPLTLVEKYGVDATRYLLISALSFGQDGDLPVSNLEEIYTGKLSNGLGNLLQRTVTLIKRSGITIEPGAAPSCADADKAIEELRLDHGLREVWKIVDDANKRLEKGKPWELLSVASRSVASSKDEQLKQILTTSYRQLETIAAGLVPYMPGSSAEILSQLKSLEAKPLFPRI